MAFPSTGRHGWTVRSPLALLCGCHVRLKLLIFRRIATRLAHGMVVALAIGAVTVAHAARPVVYETGYEIVPLIQFPSLHWVGSDRLLFWGMKASQGERPDLRRLYVWNAATKAVTFYADAEALCVADGKVFYSVRAGSEVGKKVMREGLFGAEKEVRTSQVKDLPDRGSVYSHLTCKAHTRSELKPSALKSRSIVVLKESDGYLDLGLAFGARLTEGEQFPRNVVLYRQSEAISLPLLPEENFSPFDVAFSEYKHAYVLRPRAPREAERGISRSWPTGQRLIAYLLWPEGRTETVFFPYLPIRFLLEPRPIKGGWILGGGDARTAGLYMYDGKVISKAEAGFVRQISVSPDGCRGAVGIQNKHREMGTPIHVKVFDFCSAER